MAARLILALGKGDDVKKNYTIALCDILGFSSLVQRNPLDAVVHDAVGWFQQSMCHAMSKDSWPDATPTLADIDRNALIGIALFSDTILIWTKVDEDDALRELIQTVAWLTFANISGNTKIRGGISYGEAFIDPANSLFVGTAIIDAYSIESRQQWSGVALTESAVNRVPPFVHDGRFSDWPIVPYDVPLKQGATIPTLAVNWTYGIHRDLRMDWSASKAEPTEEEWKTKPSICEKWRNTRQFHADICQHCNRPMT